MVIKAIGHAETHLTISLKKPRELTQKTYFKHLAESNEPLFTTDFPWESSTVQRIIFEENYKASFSTMDKDSGDDND